MKSDKRKVTNKSRVWEKTFAGNPNGRELVEVSLFIRHETERAWLVTDGTKDAESRENKVWLPKSQCQLDEDPQDSSNPATFSVPVWLAEEKGFV